MGRPKKCNYDLIDRNTDEEPWALLERLVNDHHPSLSEVRFALLWRRELKPDADRKLTLGKSMKVADADKELAGYDWKIILNKEAWGDFSSEQRAAVMDHEITHCDLAADRKTCEVRRDVRGRLVLRARRHDIEEFSSIIERHGLYTSSLVKFAESMDEKRKIPLFADQIPETPPPNGEARKPKTRSSRRRSAV